MATTTAREIVNKIRAGTRLFCRVSVTFSPVQERKVHLQTMDFPSTSDFQSGTVNAVKLSFVSNPTSLFLELDNYTI
jgi:hypothetical protein